MNGYDGLRRGRDGAFDEFRIDICSLRVNIHENRTRAAIRDGFGRGDKCVWRRDDFVAVLDAERKQAEVKSARTGIEGDAVVRPADCCELPFKSFNLGAEDETCIAAHAIEGRQHFIAERCVLSLEIE